MAYSRDWDRGKSAWDDAGAWGDVSGRGNLRPRDEDHQGDGKRRKYNHGVILLFLQCQDYLMYLKGLQGYDTSQAYDENTTYDTTTVQAQSSLPDDRPHRNFVKKRLTPSEPSPHVIFLGLDPDFTEADVCRLPHVLAMIFTSLKRYPARSFRPISPATAVQ